MSSTQEEETQEMAARQEMAEYDAAVKRRRDLLETELRQAWVNFTEKYEVGRYSAEHALEAIGREVESWADSNGQFKVDHMEMVDAIFECAAIVGRRE